MMSPAEAALGAGAIFLASLVGSAHCAGMCGPLAIAACSDGGGCSSTGPSIRAQWRYHLARGCSYGLVGAIAGAVGSLADAAGSLARIQHLSSMLAGATLAIVGVVMLLRWRGVSLHTPGLPEFLVSPIRRVHVRTLRLPAPTRAVTLGLVTPLLPCGWLWAFVAFAAGTGHPVSGIIVLVSFWAGTIPAVALVVGGARLAARRVSSSRFGRWLQPAVALLLIAVGVELAIHRADLADRVMTIVVREMTPQGRSQAGHQSGQPEASPAIEDRPACCRDTTQGTP